MTWLFIHIAKTGGTSVRDVLGQIGTHGELALEGRKQHDEARTIAKTLDDPVLWRKLFKFAVVRNPYDRAVSAYCYMRGGIGPGGMGEWVEQVEANRAKKGRWGPPLRPQWDYLSCGTGGHLMMDYVARFENLAYELQEIASRAQLPLRRLQHLNRTVHRDGLHYRAFLDEEPAVREWIERTYAEDLHRFEYVY